MRQLQEAETALFKRDPDVFALPTTRYRIMFGSLTFVADL
jgi:hypothetical protein